MEIPDLESVLRDKLRPGFRVKDYSLKPLTKIGDNYGSAIAALTVNLVNEDTKEEETLQLVSKELPRNEELYKLFQVESTFVKEASIYTVVVPLLLAFQREKNVPEDKVLNSFVECFGSRKSLDPKKEEVDSGAVLILENLNFQGFKVGDRVNGFDQEHAEFVLKNLAQFHGVLIAFKRDRPEEFKRSILPWLNKLDIDEGLAEKDYNDMMDALWSELASVPELVPLMDRLRRQVKECQRIQADLQHYDESPFNSFCHSDFWVNNMMIGYQENDPSPKKFKIIDFQFIHFSSIARDILFFIFTSLERSVFETKIDYLLNVYYEELFETLRVNGCPLEEFGKESFLKEINSVAKYELYHILIMTKVLKVDKEKMHAKEEFSMDLLADAGMIGDKYYQQLKLIVDEYEKRGWLMD